MQIYWGDIHNHNEIGYGKGTIERSFDIAENSLDFYAFTPHTWWPDLPDNDELVRQHHLNGFKKVKDNWCRIKKTVCERYRENEFVTLLAWEWHSLAWGDYCMYFPDDDGEFIYASTLHELKEYARQNNAFIIPHHIAYRKGWRGINWNEFDSTCSPVVEIYSEHGNSLEPSSHVGMYSHSMGGIESSQAAINQLKKGRHFGFIACTDDHYGYPGGFGHGITAVAAEKLDRTSIFNAIKKRHTYAATGDRIKIDFRVNEGIMGDFIEPADSAAISFNVEARDKLKSVEVYKNGSLFSICSELDFAGQHIIPDVHMVRIEWGWDMIASKKITKWNMGLKCIKGEIDNIVPAFCGGSASVEETNMLKRIDEKSWEISSFTSRRNAFPVNSLSFILKGDMSAGIGLEIEAEHNEAKFRRQMFLSKADLVDCDVYEAVLDKFSSPKLKVNGLIKSSEFSFSNSLCDDTAKPGDFYFLKVTQQNGQMAWTSPIWMQKKI